jgi:hypothetical protein
VVSRLGFLPGSQHGKVREGKAKRLNGGRSLAGLVVLPAGACRPRVSRAVTVIASGEDSCESRMAGSALDRRPAPVK